MTKDEINLWEQVSQAEGFTQYTSKDFEAKKQELNMILEDLAAEQQQTIEEYAESYHKIFHSIHIRSNIKKGEQNQI